MNFASLKSKLLLGLSIAVLFGVVGYFMKDASFLSKTPDDIVEPGETSGVEFDEGGEAIVELVPVQNNELKQIPVPNIDRPLVFGKDVPDRIRQDMQERAKDIKVALTDNPNNFSLWIELGQIWKYVNDYDGARDAWEYASALRPQNSLSFGNLADLYAYYLGDYKRAESNFVKAIDNDPKLIYLYAQAAIFYKDLLNEPEKAREMIRLGIKNNPGDVNLPKALSELESL